MNKSGHIGTSLLFFSPILLISLLLEAYAFAFLGVLLVPFFAALMIPDYDMKLPVVRHRKETHTVWSALIVGLLVGAFFYLVGHPFSSLYISVIDSATGGSGVIQSFTTELGNQSALTFGLFGFFFGTYDTLAHVLCDSFTVSRVQPFYPLKKTRFGLGVIRFDNPLANGGMLVLGSLAFIGALLGGLAV